jgi:hypothetical protein
MKYKYYLRDTTSPRKLEKSIKLNFVYIHEARHILATRKINLLYLTKQHSNVLDQKLIAIFLQSLNFKYKKSSKILLISEV